MKYWTFIIIIVVVVLFLFETITQAILVQPMQPLNL